MAGSSGNAGRGDRILVPRTAPGTVRIPPTQRADTSMEQGQLMSRAAWLYYQAGLNQEETAARLGLTRARVNKLLQLARERGIVSITIDHRDVGLLPLEERLRQRFDLELCICTPQLGLGAGEVCPGTAIAELPRRAVGAAAAQHLREVLARSPEAVVGTGWGRTLEQMTLNIAGLSAPRARFVSLMGSLVANSACNPFEVVQGLARSTGGEGYFLPVPFIADTERDRDVLLSQVSVARPLELARNTDLALISVGELTGTSLLRVQQMISDDDLSSLRAAGAVGDTNGIFFDRDGRPVDHPLNARTLAVGFEDLTRSCTVILAAGHVKVEAVHALLRSGMPSGLIIDGDAALELAALIDGTAT